MAGVPDKNAFKAGVFILVALSLVLGVFFAVNGFGWRPGHTWTIRFDVGDDVGGLGPGAEVRIGGVKQGQVERVALAGDLAHVDVSVSLPRHVVLKDKPRVSIQSTVTGVSWLNFDSLGDGQPLPPGSVIAGEAGTFSNLVAAANRIAPGVAALVDDVRETTLPKFNGLVDKTGQTMDSVGTAATRAGDTAATVDDLLKSNRPAVEQTLANLRDASERAPSVMEQAELLVQSWTGVAEEVGQALEGTGARLDRVLDSAQVIADDMKGAAKDTQATVKDVRGLIAGNRGKIEQIISRSREASATLSLAASEIRRSPWRLLYKPDGGQRESLDLYDAARRFAEGANALQDAAVALDDASRDPTADPEKVRQMLEELQRKFQEFDQVERLLYERLRD